MYIHMRCNTRMGYGTGGLIMACHNLFPEYVIVLDQLLRDITILHCWHCLWTTYPFTTHSYTLEKLYVMCLRLGTETCFA